MFAFESEFCVHGPLLRVSKCVKVGKENESQDDVFRDARRADVDGNVFEAV